ncbi:MAG: VTT domain-containing protein [Patescibacteria group bacterium]
MNSKRIELKEALFFSFFTIAFLVVSIFSLLYGDSVRTLIASQNLLSIVIYVLFLITSEVVVPVSSLVILPLAVSVWGSLFTAIITLIGWFIGAIISFWLARRFGQPFIGKIIDIKRLEQLSHFVPEKNLFWAVIILRIIFPVDIFSYILGLFTNVGFWPYFWGTLIGIIPFGFLFAYGVRLPIQYQAIIGLLLIVGVILYYDRSRKKIMEWIKIR